MLSPAPSQYKLGASRAEVLPSSPSFARAPSQGANPNGQQPYHQWVEDKFEQYREEIRGLQQRVGHLQQQLASSDVANKRALQGTSAEREEDLMTIAKLEKMVERFRTESQKVLNDHLKLQTRYQDASGQQEKLKQRIMQLDVELRQLNDASAKDRAALEAALENERNTRRQLAAQLQQVTEQLARESDARNDADRSAAEAQRQLVALEVSGRDSSARTEKSARVIQDLKEQIRFLTTAVEEQRRAAEKDLDESQRAQEKSDAAVRDKDRQIASLEEELHRAHAKVEAREKGTERMVADHKYRLDEAEIRVNHYRKLADDLQRSHTDELDKNTQSVASVMGENATLSEQLADAVKRNRLLEADQRTLNSRISELDSVIDGLRREKLDLVGQLEDHVVNGNALCSKLASVEGQLNQTVLDESAGHERLQSLHEDVVRLQKMLADVTTERERYRDAMNELDKECNDLQKRLGEKQQASSDTLGQLRELSGRNDALTMRMSQTSSERAVLQEKIEALEHRIVQLKADRDLAVADTLKVSRDAQRQAIAHAQEVDDVRLECEQKLAEAARAASKSLQDALFEEQQKRQVALNKALEGIDADPRVVRAHETEARNVQLQRQLHELEDHHAQDIAAKERALRAIQSQLAIGEREREDLQRDRDRERESRRAHDEMSADQTRSQHLLRTEFSIFIQNSEAWLREVLQKVALLTMQKLHGDFIVTALHRHQLFELNKRLRSADERIEVLQGELSETQAKVEGLNDSLINEISIGKELNAKYAGRSQFMSPNRTAPSFRGSLSEMAMHAERCDPARESDDAFVLLTRWELVSALCKQDLRCEAANESAVSLFKQWEAETFGGYGALKNAKPEITAAMVDLVELVQAITNYQGDMTRSFLTDREKALLQSSKAAVF